MLLKGCFCMKKSLTVGCVIMASGLSRRFGTNKLLADFCGQPMLCRAFDATATPGIAARIVETRSEDVPVSYTHLTLPTSDLV